MFFPFFDKKNQILKNERTVTNFKGVFATKFHITSQNFPTN